MAGIELIKTRFNKNNEMKISGRELHAFLNIKSKYLDWFNAMLGYGFVVDLDFELVSEKKETKNPKNPFTTYTDHLMSIDMAKELSMIQRNERGKQARQYFLEIERRWNSPEMVMKRALEYANEQVIKLESRIEEQKPKVLLAESIENSDSLILVGELAKILRQNGVDIGQNRLFERLRDMGYLVKGGTQKNIPTQRSVDLGLFRIVHGTRSSSDGITLTKTTKVTGKGQKYFVNKFLKEVKG